MPRDADGEPVRGDAETGATPEISIITPCYNAVRHLRDAIESVRRQAGVRVEHIVVDAGSQGRNASKSSANIRTCDGSRSRTSGQADAFNKGLAMARAPLIGWLNADDFYEPGAIAAGRPLLPRASPARSW